MGKFKSLVTQALDNNSEPLYNYLKLTSRNNCECKRNLSDSFIKDSKAKETKPNWQRTMDKPFVQAKESTRQA